MLRLNRKRLGDNTYAAHFNNQTVIVFAVSEPSARQKAHEYYRPKKHERDLIEVELVSED